MESLSKQQEMNKQNKGQVLLTQEEIKEFESYKKVLKNGEHEIVEEDENDLIMGVEQEEDEEESIGSNSLDEDIDELQSINNDQIVSNLKAVKEPTQITTTTPAGGKKQTNNQQQKIQIGSMTIQQDSSKAAEGSQQTSIVSSQTLKIKPKVDQQKSNSSQNLNSNDVVVSKKQNKPSQPNHQDTGGSKAQQSKPNSSSTQAIITTTTSSSNKTQTVATASTTLTASIMMKHTSSQDLTNQQLLSTTTQSNETNGVTQKLLEKRENKDSSFLDKKDHDMIEEESVQVNKKKKRRMKQTKLVMNIAWTKYHVIKYVAKKMYNMRFTYDDSDDWDVCWVDSAIQSDRLYRMKPYQRVNHFPGMNALSRKNHLARNLSRMQQAFPEEYDFFPKTWILPAEMSDFRKQFGENGKRKRKTYISKPQASCQGKGIFLTRNLDDFDPFEHYVVQRYLHKPFLIDKLKFDLRIYVLLCGVDPLRIYIYQEGLCRLATVEYQLPTDKNIDNLNMHLTNYAINKSHSNFQQNKGVENDNLGHKRSLTFALKYIEEMGHDSKAVYKDIKNTIIKTIFTVQPVLSHIYKSCQPDDTENSMCFEILGFDIFLDEKLKPWIIEVNHSPSFSTDSPLDFKVKKNVVADSIRLLGLSYQRKMKYKKQQALLFQKRALKGKTRLTQEERAKIRIKKAKQREKFEEKNIGQYELVFPSEEFKPEENQKFIDRAKEIHEEFYTSSFQLRQNKLEKEQQEKQQKIIQAQQNTHNTTQPEIGAGGASHKATAKSTQQNFRENSYRPPSDTKRNQSSSSNQNQNNNGLGQNYKDNYSQQQQQRETLTNFENSTSNRLNGATGSSYRQTQYNMAKIGSGPKYMSSSAHESGSTISPANNNSQIISVTNPTTLMHSGGPNQLGGEIKSSDKLRAELMMQQQQQYNYKQNQIKNHDYPNTHQSSIILDSNPIQLANGKTPQTTAQQYNVLLQQDPRIKSGSNKHIPPGSTTSQHSTKMSSANLPTTNPQNKPPSGRVRINCDNLKQPSIQSTSGGVAAGSSQNQKSQFPNYIQQQQLLLNGQGGPNMISQSEHNSSQKYSKSLQQQHAKVNGNSNQLSLFSNSKSDQGNYNSNKDGQVGAPSLQTYTNLNKYSHIKIDKSVSLSMQYNNALSTQQNQGLTGSEERVPSSHQQSVKDQPQQPWNGIKSTTNQNGLGGLSNHHKSTTSQSKLQSANINNSSYGSQKGTLSGNQAMISMIMHSSQQQPHNQSMGWNSTNSSQLRPQGGHIQHSQLKVQGGMVSGVTGNNSSNQGQQQMTKQQQSAFQQQIIDQIAIEERKLQEMNKQIGKLRQQQYNNNQGPNSAQNYSAQINREKVQQIQMIQNNGQTQYLQVMKRSSQENLPTTHSLNKQSEELNQVIPPKPVHQQPVINFNTSSTSNPTMTQNLRHLNSHVTSGPTKSSHQYTRNTQQSISSFQHHSTTDQSRHHSKVGTGANLSQFQSTKQHFNSQGNQGSSFQSQSNNQTVVNTRENTKPTYIKSTQAHTVQLHMGVGGTSSMGAPFISGVISNPEKNSFVASKSLSSQYNTNVKQNQMQQKNAYLRKQQNQSNQVSQQQQGSKPFSNVINNNNTSLVDSFHYRPQHSATVNPHSQAVHLQKRLLIQQNQTNLNVQGSQQFSNIQQQQSVKTISIHQQNTGNINNVEHTMPQVINKQQQSIGVSPLDIITNKKISTKQIL